VKDTVLIIEDDREIAEVVATNLRDLGLETERVTNGRTGLDRSLEGDFSLIILDLMLPEMDGLTICSRIREKDPVTPILMLTARSEEVDRVVGLEIGADDYLTKPFSVREMTARVKALLRRARTGIPTQDEGLMQVAFGSLTLDEAKRKVTLNDQTIELTVKEFELLALFMKNPGRAYSRTDLLNLVWGYQFEGYEHTVNTHINRLRGKIEPDPANPAYLKTLWGVGYRFAELSEFSESST
jgi:DNA-binding response OmpR family regulator